MARQLHLHDRDILELTCYGKRLSLRVARIAPVPGGTAFRPQLAIPAGMLAGLPVLFHGGLRADPAQVPSIERAVYERFPAIATMDAGELLASAQGLVDTLSAMLRLVSWFVVASGLMILGAGVAASSSRRIYETAILRLLGATRLLAAAMIILEFLVLGAVAAGVGVACGVALASLALHQVFGLPGLAMSWQTMVAAICAMPLLTTAAGFLATLHTLRGAPLEALREH
jgi:putative ABC transport system permease protein